MEIIASWPINNTLLGHTILKLLGKEYMTYQNKNKI